MPHDSKFLDYEPVIRSRAKDEQSPAEVRNSARDDGSSAKNGKPEVTDEHDLSLKEPSLKETKTKWILRRGHAISYAGLFLFTVVLFFRPYEQISALSSFTSMAFWIAIATLLVFLPSQLALEGTLTARPREVNLALLLCLTGLLSVPTAINPVEAWDTFNDPFLKAVVIFIVIVNVVRTELRLKALLVLVLAVSLVLSAAAVNDYRIGNLSLQEVRILGVIGNLFNNPNDLALHLATIVPIAVALFLSSRNPAKILYGVGAVLMAAAVVVTFSRGGFLGLVVAVAVLSWKLGRSNRLLVTVLIVVIGVSFMIFSPTGYSDRLASIFDSQLDPFGSASSRRELFFRSLWTMLRHPVFGVGMGNFHTVSIHEQVSHNAYTQVGAEMGIAACVIYVMFIVSALKRLGRLERETLNTRNQKQFYYLSIGLQASLIGYMVSSFFASVAYLWYIYYLVGYAVTLDRIYSADKQDAIGATNPNRLSLQCSAEI